LITIDQVRQRAEMDARTNGCYLNPDKDFLNDLFSGLKTNEERYGYPLCPCRLATGKFELDRDINCPCDYRDPDVKEFGACYCALYVNRDISEGKIQIKPVRERRPKDMQARAYGLKLETQVTQRAVPSPTAAPIPEAKIKLKFHYCRQCGYVCFRESPPYICPICKAKREMFAELPVQPEGAG
jgi:ferredoxin-thioredoxin reductase catalytic chain